MLGAQPVPSSVCVLLTWVCLCLCSLMSNHLGWCFYLKRFTTIIVTSTLEQPEVKGIVHTNICRQCLCKIIWFFFIYKSRYCGECSHWSFTIKDTVTRGCPIKNKNTVKFVITVNNNKLQSVPYIKLLYEKRFKSNKIKVKNEFK